MILLYGVLFLKMYMLFLCNLMPFNPMQYTAFHQVRFYDTTLWCSIPEDVHAVSVQHNAFYPVQYTAFHQVRFYDTTLLCSIPEDVHAVSVQP